MRVYTCVCVLCVTFTHAKVPCRVLASPQDSVISTNWNLFGIPKKCHELNVLSKYHKLNDSSKCHSHKLAAVWYANPTPQQCVSLGFPLAHGHQYAHGTFSIYPDLSTSVYIYLGMYLYLYLSTPVCIYLSSIYNCLYLSSYPYPCSMYICLHLSRCKSVYICMYLGMGWLWLVGSTKLLVSLAKEPYKRDNILQKRPIISSILLTVATPYLCLSTPDRYRDRHRQMYRQMAR